ncbi:MAG: hypothetical protein HY665_05625 [Chloroflexi bacterium]|nr:hypothetical protein [Chloroflexota bacterium]
MNMNELRDLCVDRFPLSTTRPLITKGFEAVATELYHDDIKGEIWVNGSFVTEKMNPEDVDFVLRVPAEVYDNGSKSQRKRIDWLANDLKTQYHCDSYCFMEWPENHPNYWFGQYMHSYWMKQFGFSRRNEMKGIAVIALPGGIIQ